MYSTHYISIIVTVCKHTMTKYYYNLPHLPSNSVEWLQWAIQHSFHHSNICWSGNKLSITKQLTIHSLECITLKHTPMTTFYPVVITTTDNNSDISIRTTDVVPGIITVK